MSLLPKKNEWRRPCEHGVYTGPHLVEDDRPRGGIIQTLEIRYLKDLCPGGSSFTTKDMLDALVEEGVLTTEMYVTGFRRQDKQWRYVGVDWHEVTEVEVDPLLIREEQ